MTESDANASASAAQAVPDMRPGRMLAEARARKNLTIPEVAQQLKLSASQIEALEADAYARLPGPVFVRGFVRNYARLVDLDGEALIAALDLPHQPTIASAAVPRSSNIPFPERYPARWPRYAAALLLLVGALALYALLTDEREIVVTAHAPLASAPAVTPAATPPVMTPVTASAATPASPPATVAIKSPQVAVSASAPAPAAVVKERPDAAGRTDVHFTFITDSWVEVRDRNNRILLSQLNRAGTEHRLQGRAPLSLVVGNAQGVRLTYKGAPFDLTPHTRVEVARFTLE